MSLLMISLRYFLHRIADLSLDSVSCWYSATSESARLHAIWYHRCASWAPTAVSAYRANHCSKREKINVGRFFHFNLIDVPIFSALSYLSCCKSNIKSKTMCGKFKKTSLSSWACSMVRDNRSLSVFFYFLRIRHYGPRTIPGSQTFNDGDPKWRFPAI